MPLLPQALVGRRGVVTDLLSRGPEKPMVRELQGLGLPTVALELGSLPTLTESESQGRGRATATVWQCLAETGGCLHLSGSRRQGTALCGQDSIGPKRIGNKL